MDLAGLDKVKKYYAVFIAPHPDDIEFGCAGLCRTYASQGFEVLGVTLTDGRRGMDPDPVRGRLPYSRKELVQIRKSEQSASAKILGYDLLWLGLPDLRGENKERASRLIETVLQRARPEILVVPVPDTHPTHRRAYRVCLEAARSHPVNEILFYGVWDIYGSSGTALHREGLQRVEVPIPESSLELKKLALFAHQSQMGRPQIKKLYTDLVSSGRFSTEHYAKLTTNYTANLIPKAT